MKIILCPLCFFAILAFGTSCQKDDGDVQDPVRTYTMAVFGGSYSIIPESAIAKKTWRERLNVETIEYGVGGAGFSLLSSQNSIQSQVDVACADRKPVYDIYLLWASTNDFNKCNNKPGTVSDYSIEDGFSHEALDTQCGGINYCLTKIKERAPDALILFFSSSPIFGDERGYSTEYEGTDGMKHFVRMQEACCNLYNVPFLDQYNNSTLTIDNWNECFQTDGIHLNESGYMLLLEKQMPFLEAQIIGFRNK